MGIPYRKFRWVGDELKDIQSRHPATKQSIRAIADVIYQNGEITREILIEKLKERGDLNKVITAGAHNYLPESINYLSGLGLIEVEYRRRLTQLKQVMKETGLSKGQICNYRLWLKNAGIFPAHELRKDNQYSEEEMGVLRRMSKHMGGNSVHTSISLALSDVYSKDSSEVQQFNLWWKKYMKEQILKNRRRKILRLEEGFKDGILKLKRTPLNYNIAVKMYYGESYTRLSELHNFILEKLIEDFSLSHEDMLKSYPLNLFFAIYRPFKRHIRTKFTELMSSARSYTNFMEYENNIFNAYIGLLDEISRNVKEPFRHALDKLHKERRRQAEIIDKRYVNVKKLKTFETIGEEIGVKRQGVHQLDSKAIGKLKTYKEINDLATELVF